MIRRKKQKKKAVILAGCLAAVFCAGAAGYGIAAVGYEKRVGRLEKEVEDLNEKIKRAGKVEWSETGFNYLAIGNSITKHGLCDYWWNEIGMAATTQENDYVHRVTSFLEEKNDEVCMMACNYAVWEGQARDRAETFELINKYLDDRVDLVTVQLGENVSDLTTYEADYEELLRHIRKNAPSAQILVIDDFWQEGDRSFLKEAAAANTGATFVSLAAIVNREEYQCGMGTIVYDADGEAHTVTHEGVAAHPGDLGMEYIADEIIKALEQ